MRSLMAGAMIWELAARWAPVSFLPPFSRVVARAFQLIANGEIAAPLAMSVLSLIAGFSTAAVLGLALGIVMGRNRTLELVLAPFLTTALAAPKVALVPVLYAAFGLSRVIQVLVVFLSAFFVIAIGAMRAVQAANPEYAGMARAFGATERQLARHILLPGAAPLIMAGLRLAAGQAVRAMVSAEMFVTVFGLGGLLRRFGGRFDAEGTFAVLLVVVAVAVCASLAIESAARRWMPWTEARAR